MAHQVGDRPLQWKDILFLIFSNAALPHALTESCLHLEQYQKDSGTSDNGGSLPP